jgi:hypothetical protein
VLSCACGNKKQIHGTKVKWVPFLSISSISRSCIKWPKKHAKTTPKTLTKIEWNQSIALYNKLKHSCDGKW